MIVETLLNQAFGLIGITNPSAEELSDAMTALNILSDEIFSTPQGDHDLTLDSHALTSGTENYTIGTGATIDTLRPATIHAAFVSKNDIGYPLQLINGKDYAMIGHKDEQGIPSKLWYNPTYTDQTDGTLYLWQVPLSGYTLWLYSTKPQTDYSTISANIAEPPEYISYFKWEIACELATSYGRQITPYMYERRRGAYKRLRAVHIKAPTLQTKVISGKGTEQSGLMVGTANISTLPFTLA